MQAAIHRNIGPWLISVMLGAAVAAHGALLWAKRDLRPELAILDSPPAASAREILALGDREFLYRQWILDLQDAGDTGGRTTPLRDYNYDHVLQWLQALQSLDDRAQAHLDLATHYFSLTPREADVRRLIAFVVDDALKRPGEKWYWIVQSVDHAETRLHDLPYALSLAQQLAASDAEQIPNWARFTPAVLLAKMGRKDEARASVVAVAAKWDERLTKEEKEWVREFLQGLFG
jgi:hypothetical protein